MQTGMVGLQRKGRDRLRRLLRGGEGASLSRGRPGVTARGLR